MNYQRSFLSVMKSMCAILILLFLAYGCGSNSTGSESSGPTFDSGFLSSGQTFSFTFSEEGSVPYYCRNHVSEGMTGRVTVSQDAAISGQDTVIMKNKQFQPSQITVAPDTKIVWINAEEDASIMDHTVTSGTGPGSGGGGPY